MSQHPSKPRLGPACATALLGAALIACSAGQESQDGIAADTTRPEPGMDGGLPGPEAGSAAEAVQVVLTEFDLHVTEAEATAQGGNADPQSQPDRPEPPTDTIPAGEVTFQIRNAGSLEHSFEIEGREVEEKLSEALARGEMDSLTVELEPGTYHLYCPLANHEARGMTMTLVVAPSNVTALRSGGPPSR